VDDRERLAREAVRKVKQDLGSWRFSKQGNLKWHRDRLAKEPIGLLLYEAWDGDDDAIELVREYARKARIAGETVPRALYEFAIEWFIDGKPRGKRAATSAKETTLRNRAITLLVMVATECGFPVYANSEYRGTSDGPMTACRMDAEEVGLAPHTVEEIYRKRNPRPNWRRWRPNRRRVDEARPNVP